MSASFQKMRTICAMQGSSASHLHGASAMNEDQEHDYAYHQDKLLMLVARRGKQQPNSDQIPKLDAEIAAVRDLLRSYRILKAME
jgi:hypothetical protein